MRRKRPHPRPTPHAPVAPPEAPVLQSLEPRMLMSGDVSVRVIGDTLYLRGDVEDNQIEITQEDGVIAIEGDETTVNGAESVEIEDEVRHIKIRMQQGGEDEVVLLGEFELEGNLDARLGEGEFTLEGSEDEVAIEGKLKIRGGEASVFLRNAIDVEGKVWIVTDGEAHVVAGRAEVPDFDEAAFDASTTVDNPYFPIVTGAQLVYEVEGVDPETGEETAETIIIDMPADTIEIAGIEARMIRDRVFEDGLLIEDTFDYYAQDNDGNVWYLGEDVINYEYDDDGNVISTDNDGAWLAGEDDAVAGVIMMADPQVGQRYYQEFQPNGVLDQGEVISLGESLTVPAGTFTDLVRIQDTTVVEPDGIGQKLFAPGLGMVGEVDIHHITGEVYQAGVLVSIELNGVAVTQLVDPAAFEPGENASGETTEENSFEDDVHIRAGEAMFVIGTKFEDDTRLRSWSEMSIAESVFEDSANLLARDSIGIRRTAAEDDVRLRSWADVTMLDSTFEDRVRAIFSRGDDTLRVGRSTFDCLVAYGGRGENTFDDLGGNVFDKLVLRRFET